MMTTSYGNAVSMPGYSDNRARRQGWLEGCRVAPVFAPPTGEVRPQTGDHALIADMTAPESGKGLAWVQTWRPPD